MPWRLFASAKHVLDAGTGAGFPGIPLAVVFPSIRFTLSESVGKKARFVEAAVKDLALANVTVVTQRAEEALRSKRADVITARAVAPIRKALDLFGPALSQGSRALLYKGPDGESEIAEAAPELKKRRVQARLLEQYELPESSGSRSIVELSAYQLTK